MLSYIVYLILFASYFTAIVLYFLPNIIQYKAFVIGIDVVFFISVLYYKLANKISLKKCSALMICFILILAVYSLTPLFYYYSNSQYVSFKLVLIAQTLPAILSAAIINSNEYFVDKLKRLAPIVSLLFSIVSFYTAFYPVAETTGGFAAGENLTYQNISYMSATAAGFTLFYLLSFQEIKWPLFFKRKIAKKIMCVMLIVNLLSIFVAGGRGGLVLFGVLCICSYYIYINTSSRKRNMAKFFIPIFCVVVLVFSIQFVARYSLSTNGFSRIVSTVSTGDDNGRSLLREKAYSAFLDSPFYGHGLGSVFYEIKEYTHNCITDMLVEGGFGEVFVYLYLVFYTIKKIFKLISVDISESLWLFLFLDSFIMSLFSGYYLGFLSEFFVIAMMYVRKIQIGDNSISKRITYYKE